jgi:hypothetical protein
MAVYSLNEFAELMKNQYDFPLTIDDYMALRWTESCRVCRSHLMYGNRYFGSDNFILHDSVDCDIQAVRNVMDS